MEFNVNIKKLNIQIFKNIFFQIFDYFWILRGKNRSKLARNAKSCSSIN